nr:uncharacterized RING finger protein C32D5.10-like [Malus domestica]
MEISRTHSLSVSPLHSRSLSALRCHSLSPLSLAHSLSLPHTHSHKQSRRPCSRRSTPPSNPRCSSSSTTHANTGRNQLSPKIQDNPNFEGETCRICMNAIIDRGVLDCCQHWFCFSCIDNWATITNLCPLCQNEFQMITCVSESDANKQLSL